jgi:hypothetical protein
MMPWSLVVHSFSEKISASIFMIEEQRMKVTSSSAYSLTMDIESVRSSETLVKFLQDYTASHPRSRGCEKVKS